jgi:hypothetical protein
MGGPPQQMANCITQVTFQGDGFAKPVVARFDLPDASTDGGLMLLKALDSQLGLTVRLADVPRASASQSPSLLPR